MSKLFFEKVHEDAIIPQRATAGASGYDLHAHRMVKMFCGSISGEGQLDDKYITPVFTDHGVPQYTLPKHHRALITTGIRGKYDRGELQVRPRSGLALKHGITIVNTPGTVDNDYIGEIGVILMNTSDDDFVFNKGDRIAQIVPVTLDDINVVVLHPGSMEKTVRGDGGYGHTDNKNNNSK